jgi:uncharacterized protein (TIGR04255 family)
MALKEQKRIIYANDTLLDVTCQFRFPTILKISSDTPVEFQEEIRHSLPIFDVRDISGLPPEISKMIPNMQFSIPTGKSYIFTSEDKVLQLELNNDSITLTTTDYKRYELFKDTFIKSLSAFEKTYKPSFYSRVGLRYRNLIIRSSLNLEDTAWSELIPFYIAPELHLEEIKSEVVHSQKQVRIETEAGTINYNHGLVNVSDSTKGTNEVSYLIDSDFFKEGSIPKDEARIVIDNFNRSARNLFRWSVTEKLHEAMEPRNID